MFWTGALTSALLVGWALGGILFGKMVLELGDVCTARNDAHDLNADIEFKTRGFFSGTYNAIAGRVQRDRCHERIRAGVDQVDAGRPAIRQVVASPIRIDPADVEAT